MREILFRGKRLDNGEWVYGAYHKHDTVKVCITGDDPKTKHIIIADGFCDWGFEPPLMGYHVDPSTVGQFPGLCDKNGKKIFEGDIVAIERWCETVKYHVFFDPQICRFVGDSINYVGFTTFEDDGMYMAVVGNKWDNPELLEGEG